jgi:cephalosporin hydroxylase
MKQLIEYLDLEETNLKDAYHICAKTPSDINAHFPVMATLAKECSHITEFGARYGVSTVCWLAAKPSRFVTYDIHPKGTVNKVGDLSEGTDFEFKTESSIEASIEKTDLLFIDSFHTYDHLKQELNLHAHNVAKYIVMHDTESCGLVGGHKTGAKGLKPAIAEFLDGNEHWDQLEHYPNSNGLTVLKRNTDNMENQYRDDQIQALIQVVNLAVDNPVSGMFVEIGCWKGKSTASIANKCWPNPLHACDTWKGNIDEGNVTGKLHPTAKVAASVDVRAIFDENIANHTKGNVEVHQMDCFAYLDVLSQSEYPIKFCHIDASHDYESVKKTIEMLLPRLTEGAILCGDDIASAHRGRLDLEGGVERAVMELLPGYIKDKNFWWWSK